MKTALNLRHLYAFIAVAREGNFTRAAEHLLLSQSTLTVTIRQLEEQLGVSLFNRTTRQVILTADGENFLKSAEQVVDKFEEAIVSVRQSAAQRGGHVSIAVLPSIAIRLLPEIVQAFHETHPDIRITLRDDNGRGVHRQVLDRDVDFGISNMWHPYPELEFTPLTTDRFGLVCRRDDPLAEMEAPLNWAMIDEQRLFVMAGDTGVYKALQESVEFTERFKTPAGEVLAMVTLLEMVRTGLGVTVVPQLARPSENEPDLVFRRVSNPVLIRRICLIRRHNEALSPGARRVWDTIRAQVPREVEG
ncbi:MAG: LysR family transcriptional regulator [Hyphomicrobiales bacterium]|nr:LysR family transcriptional regulator [Hyphomicrobiales bacterium]MCP4999054.1 LysR family transcriptional regulator [Hyphomicrobiales bacterium]